MGKRLDQLHDLVMRIDEIKTLMIDVATWRRSLDDADPEYREAYARAALDLEALAEMGVPVRNPNAFGTLWQWNEYWRSELRTYASRRAYVHDMYQEVLSAVEAVDAEGTDRVLSDTDIDRILSHRFAPGLADVAADGLFDGVHPLLIARTRRAFEAGDLDDAVFAAFKTVEEQVRSLSGFGPTDLGMDLMSKAFGGRKPRVLLSGIAPEQEAMHSLFRGAIGAFKNPLSHRSLNLADRALAAEMIGLASLLLRLLESRSPVEHGDS